MKYKTLPSPEYLKVIRAVRQYETQYKRPPTIREIMDITGISSTSVVRYHLGIGVERGHIEQIGADGEARNYRATEA